MKVWKAISALCAFFVLALALAACGGGSGSSNGVPSGDVAVVAGNPISVQAFRHWMFIAAKGNTASSPGAPVIIPTDPPKFENCIKQVRKEIPSLAKIPDKTIRADCQQLFTSLTQQVMGYLITAYWYQLEAHKLGISVSDAKVRADLTRLRKPQFPTLAQFNAFLKSSGQTEADILYRVKVSDLITALTARYAKHVTPAAIQAYFTSHPTEFSTQQTRDIRIIRNTNKAQVVAAIAALKSGESWQKVAKVYSIDAITKANGGLISSVTPGMEEKALNDAAFGAKKGVLLGPIHGTFGWYAVEVVKITPATHQTLAQATPLIKEILNSQSSTSAQTALNTLIKSWLKQTYCLKEYSMQDCKGYKPPKPVAPPITPTTTPPPPTTTSTPTSSSSSSSSTTAGSSSSSSG